MLDALKAGQVDVAATNATSARAADVNFTPALVFLELGYLTVPRSPVQAPEDVLRAGVRVGVSQGSTTQATLPGLLKQAQVVPGRWGHESLAIAIPKGRAAAVPFVLRFSEEVKRDGTVQRAAERAGLRGTMPAP